MLFNAKKRIEKLPRAMANLSKGMMTDSLVKPDKINYCVKGLVFIFIFAGIYNTQTATGQSAVLRTTQDSPVGRFGIHEVAIAHCDSGKSPDSEFAGTQRQSDFQLIKQLIKTPAPMQISKNHINDDRQQQAGISILCDKLDEFNHYFSLYCVAVCFLFICTPLIYLCAKWLDCREHKRFHDNLLEKKRN